MSAVSSRVRRLLLLFLLAPAARAGDERLGQLIRFYLAEPSPARQEDFLEAIERLADGDAARVAAAIRAGAHFRRPERPVLKRGGDPPGFAIDRPRVQPVEGPGDFAELVLPVDYDRARAYPLIVELGRTRLAVPAGAVLLRVDTAAHEQARTFAWAAEALVLSLVAAVFEQVDIDPDRVFLRAEGARAALAWYVALHNPDRFAGVLGARGLWPEGRTLASNGRWFNGLAIERRKGDPRLEPFMAELRRFNPAHRRLAAPPTAARDAELLPEIESWFRESKRRVRSRTISLTADRGTEVRAFWLGMMPLVRSLRKSTVGRHWTQRALSHPAVLDAELKSGNLLVVRAQRVNKIVVHVDPALFDPDLPLRVSINGRPPESRLVFFEISDLLEDYRKRRDPGLLYCCRLDIPVR